MIQDSGLIPSRIKGILPVGVFLGTNLLALSRVVPPGPILAFGTTLGVMMGGFFFFQTRGQNSDQKDPPKDTQRLLDLVSSLASLADELSDTSRHLSENAATMNEMSETTMAITEEMGTTMSQTTSKSSETIHNVQQSSDSLNHLERILGQVSESASLAHQEALEATEITQHTSQLIDQLGEAASEIDQIIGIIEAIADQTKLLALNATIEAARAGESGKGFSVVACEVKELARQTDRATDGVRKKIKGMQESVSRTISEIHRTTELIERIVGAIQNTVETVDLQRETQHTIGASIEDTAACITEMVDTIRSSADTSEQISTEMFTLNLACNKVADASGQVSLGAGKLSEQSQVLLRLINEESAV